MDAKLKERFEEILNRNILQADQSITLSYDAAIKSMYEVYLDRGSEWVDVNGYKEMPEGKWLVWVETPKHGEQMFSASINTQCPIVGSLFAWDMPKVIAYSALPTPPIKEK